MDPAEEQAMEVEALESIYMDDFKKVGDAPLQMEIHLTPGEEENHVAIFLDVVAPPEYPEVQPEFTVRVDKGLAPKHVEEISKLLAEQAEENVGMACVFTLAEAAKEWLQEHNETGLAGGSSYDDMMLKQRQKEKAKAKAEEAERVKAEIAASAVDPDEEAARRRLEGTAVTPESFAAWRAAFEAEMAAKEEEVIKAAAAVSGAAGSAAAKEAKAAKEKAGRLSGRALFQKDATAFAAEAEAAAEAVVPATAVEDESLFDMADADMDELEFDLMDDLDDGEDGDGDGDAVAAAAAAAAE